MLVLILPDLLALLCKELNEKGMSFKGPALKVQGSVACMDLVLTLALLPRHNGTPLWALVSL